MKRHSATALIGLVAATTALATGSLRAQSEVPSLVSYQGIVSDGGALLGTGTPVNRDIRFRVYDASTGGTVVYSEQQTATIADGTFSVLVGAGGDIAGEAATGPSTVNIADAFNTADRYLGVTIDADGSGFGNDAEISPRQQIVTTAFAFRAKVAESAATIIDNAVSGSSIADGSITSSDIANESVTGSDIADGSVTSSDIANGSITSSDIADGSITGSDIANGTITSADIADGSIYGGDIANGSIDFADLSASARSPWTVSGNDVSRSTGKVSIATNGTGLGDPVTGTTGGSGTKLVLYPGNSTTFPYALGINGGTSWFGVPQNAQFIWYNGTTEAMRLDAARNLIVNQSVSAIAFLNSSDARIKDVAGLSDSVADLKTLSKVEVTDYTLVDHLTKDRGSQKKVIAQQINDVYPQAVTSTVGVVPDIYQLATIEGGWVQLATDLEVGEKVRLIAGKQQNLHEVLETRNGSFRIAGGPADGEVFVYGREVDDFLTVDYDALSMLNISATQEIYRQLQAEQAKNATLEKRLAKIEALLESGTLVQPVTAR